MRIAIAHDWLCGYRGGEAVLERIGALVEREHTLAGVYTLFDDGRPLSPTIDRARARGLIRAGPLSHLPGASTRYRRWLFPLYPWGVERLSRRLARDHAREPIDLLISSSSSAIKGLRPPPGVPHLCVCFNPARYVWSRLDDYSGGLRGLGLRLVARRFRAWDRRTAANVSEFIAISRYTAAEIRRCYGRDSTIVHPPTRTEFFTPDPSVPRAGFWLVVSALEPYKRADLAIEAARATGHPLVIAGEGSHRRALERAAPPSVRFEGRVTDERLRELYRSARLLLFPQVEDYGIVAVEALACGLPVVARAEGGALDIVTDGVTGALFEGESTGSILAAIARCPDPAASAAPCRASAERLGEEAFDTGIRARVRAMRRPTP